jgi:hypothetical protein
MISAITRAVQLLACEFFVVADCDEFVTVLDGLVPHAIQRYPVSRRLGFEISRTGSGYHLSEDGRALDPREDARSAADAVFWRMHDVALEAVPQFTKLHAGCATWGARRLLVVGPAQSGKTTLMTRLLYEGFSVHCDDVVLLTGADVLPYPRRFRIRPAALSLLPEVAALADRLPRDRGCLALDPAEAGFAWEITIAPADAVVFLDPVRGDSARLEACPKHVTAARIMAQSNIPADGPRAWVRDICALLDRAACYVLHSGQLCHNVAALRAALQQ